MTDIGQWLLDFIRTQGLSTVLVLGGCWFVAKQIWPAILTIVLPVWREARQAELRLKERQVVAVEKIEHWLSLVPAQGVKGSVGHIGRAGPERP